MTFIPLTSFSEVHFNNLSCNCVAFRIDDIQDHWLNNVQIEIVSLFEEKSVPLTMGIIGYHFGEDKKILGMIKKITSETDNFEIANHGWKHEDFSKLAQNQQSNLMKQTNNKISNILGINPTVFVPPFNEFTNDTLTVVCCTTTPKT